MNLRKITFGALWGPLMLLMNGCQPESKTQIGTMECAFEWSGPLYEGSNPAQELVKVDLASLLGNQFQEGMKITKIQLKSAELSGDSASGLNGIGSLVMSIASDDPSLPMKELAVLNPVSAPSGQAILKPSPEAELSEFFAQKEFYLVVDAGLTADRDQNLRLTGKFQWEIQYR
ncbi:MAG: hypothetical protein FJ350_01080 [Sphingomonadales bacterium]|nr:hypothetical protein [Sphingomonadales bacterium]MBM3923386.1 hypothetical protein [Sphingomonadales bacterium]MBM3931668.1 hypothetical protein [Sphingomonadales bacterium]